jgi:predicted ATP-grasp superfamily ATP-dependent carboligase
MISVLVTDGEQRAALAVVRSLGCAGYAPYVCSSRRRSLAGSSRFTRKDAVVPDPLADPGGYLTALEELIKQWQIEVLLPVTEASLLAILPARQRLGVQLPFPELETFLSICDKKLLMERAAEVGIAVPRQCVITRPEEINEIASQPLTFPLVIKPARSVADSEGGRVALAVCHAADAGELWARLATFPAAAYPLLLQQRIVGPGVGVFLLVWEGKLVATFAHRRLREKPPSGGISVYSESIALDPGLLERTCALLNRFGWNGLAMVEYKMDAATQTPFLMEVNARFWGSLQLAIDAGVDFPALLLKVSGGRPYHPILRYRTGVRLRWWWGDVDHLMIRLRRSSAALSLPSGAPTRWDVIRDFVRYRLGEERNEILRREDPWPFIRETIDRLQRHEARPGASNGATDSDTSHRSEPQLRRDGAVNR